MDERGSGGDEGLDQILGGGLPLNGINLIMGRPGSGKTILCQQFLFARATDHAAARAIAAVASAAIRDQKQHAIWIAMDQSRHRHV